MLMIDIDQRNSRAELRVPADISGRPVNRIQEKYEIRVFVFFIVNAKLLVSGFFGNNTERDIRQSPGHFLYQLMHDIRLRPVIRFGDKGFVFL